MTKSLLGVNWLDYVGHCNAGFVSLPQKQNAFFFQDVENEAKNPLEKVSVDQILEMQREEQLAKQAAEEKKKKAMVDRGLTPQTDPIQEDFFWFELDKGK